MGLLLGENSGKIKALSQGGSEPTTWLWLGESLASRIDARYRSGKEGAGGLRTGSRGLMKPGTAFRWVGVIDSRQRKGKEGLGLIAMEERVRFVGDTFPLESAGRGVAIMIQVPSRGESV